MSLSNYLENAFMDHVTGNGTFTTPANLYLALFTSDPMDDASGNEVFTATGYSRQVMTFSSAVNGTVTNTSPASFTASVSNFGTVGWVAIFDAVTGGNMLFYGDMNTPRTILQDQEIEFKVGTVIITAY